jgi:hypothetical protein
MEGKEKRVCTVFRRKEMIKQEIFRDQKYRETSRIK